jgi:hypothetical protein
MSPNVLRLSGFSVISNKPFNPILTSTVLLSLALTGIAQGQPQSDKQPSSQATSAAPITVPAGTSIALVLTHPIQSRYIHRGDDIYAQVISPVAAGNQVVIPAGILVQGKVERLGRNGDRGELYLQSMSFMYPDGYVAPFSGPITLTSDEGYAVKDPSQGHLAAAFALPAGGAGAGALIGHFAARSQPNTITSSIPSGCTGPPPGCLSSSVTAPGSAAKDTVIGAAVGGAIGGVASIALLLRTHSFFLDVGSPVEMVLQKPLTLEQDQVSGAISDAERHPAAVQPVAQRPRPSASTNSGTCWTPGTPGTPGTDIPGTPPIGASPGTAGIHIPGTPGTPPTPYPCP